MGVEKFLELWIFSTFVSHFPFRITKQTCLFLTNSFIHNVHYKKCEVNHSIGNVKLEDCYNTNQTNWMDAFRE